MWSLIPSECIVTAPTFFLWRLYIHYFSTAYIVLEVHFFCPTFHSTYSWQTCPTSKLQMNSLWWKWFTLESIDKKALHFYSKQWVIKTNVHVLKINHFYPVLCYKSVISSCEYWIRIIVTEALAKFINASCPYLHPFTNKKRLNWAETC